MLTARDADYPVLDESLFSEVPKGVKVYRSRILEPYRLYRTFTGRKSGESTDIATLSLDERGKKRRSERISEWIRATLFVPDARIGWLYFGYALGRKIVRQENIDVLYSSAPPYTTHLIGLKLKRKSGLPWVADFRDSWIGWLSTPQWRPRVSRKIETVMERSVLAEADRVLTVSEGVREHLLERHPELRDDRWRLLPNGFDPEDFAGIEPVSINKKLTITYLGSLYGLRNPEYLLRALERLQQKQPDLVEKLALRFVGRVGAPILKRLQTSSLSEKIEILPYLSHDKSLSYLLGTDVALLIIDDAPTNKGILTGKLYEHIGAGKPILALAPEGEAAELIRCNNLGWVVPPRDDLAIAKTLRDILQSNVRSLRTGDSFREKFERKNQAEKLSKIFNEIAAL